jgi:hypothetical protein
MGELQPKKRQSDDIFINVLEILCKFENYLDIIFEYLNMDNSSNVIEVEISNRKEFEKLIDFGTYYSGREVIATTIGVSDDSNRDEIQNNRINFVYTSSDGS